VLVLTRAGVFPGYRQMMPVLPVCSQQQQQLLLLHGEAAVLALSAQNPGPLCGSSVHAGCLMALGMCLLPALIAVLQQ